MNSILIVSIIVPIFIYYRKLDYYKVMPRKNIFAALGVGVWTYLSFRYSIWFVILGLLYLNLLDKYILD